MRFFCAACLVGIVVASLGCMTKNWSSSLFRDKSAEERNIEDDFPIWRARSINDETLGTGIDDRAKFIERRLGLKQDE